MPSRSSLHFGLAASLLAALGLVGCPSTNSPDDGGTGRDASSLDDAHATPDAFSPSDAGPVGTCDAMRVTRVRCAALCDGPDQWYWDGERCVRFDCGECVGDDCDLGVTSEAECQAAHATCEPELCRATGGAWLFWAEECQHYRCGRPQPADCLIGRPVCDCGPNRRFDPGVGCVTEGLCPDGPPSPETLCTSTGGTWENVCCPSRCGVPCEAECLAPACTCGPLEIFDPARGCVDAVECHDGRMVEQTCTTDGRVRCADGLICCQRCGGAGCFGEPTCRVPTCDPTGELDVCGNNRLAP